MKKLEDINYALMAQLSYLHWNRIDRNKIDREILNDILFKENIITQIKTDFYDDQEHYPSNEIINEKKGNLPPYVYHEEDKRLFLTYSLDKSKNRTPKFEKILDGWQYLDCASGEFIQKTLFDNSLLEKYDDSGFFGVAFQRNDDIIIAYRGTEFELALARDMLTDLKIYTKYTDIQQVEAVLFYEYIKSKYGEGKNIHLTGHSLAGAIAQYVHFYAACIGDKVITTTWNGLGSFGSVITSFQFHLDPNVDSEFKNKINSIQNKTIKDNLIKFYSKKKEELIKKRDEIKDTDHIFNFFMSEDFVGGYLNGDWLGQKQPVDIPKEKVSENLVKVLPQLLLVASLLKNGKCSLKNKDILIKIAFIYLASSFGETIESVKENMDNIEKNSNNSELTDLFKSLKAVDISQFKDFGEDMLNTLLNLFDEDGIAENGKQTLDELRRLSEKTLLPMKIFEKGKSALAFHNLNNFLVFMNDEGNINFHKMREDFRFNALKTIVIKKKEKNYRFLKGKNRNNPSEDILEIENKDVKSRIIVPANRLIQGNIFVPYPITQTDLLFKNVFKKKKFSGEDMILRNNVLDGKYNRELELGMYNNVKRLGGIIGETTLMIKIYPLDTGIQEEKVKEKRVLTFGIERKEHSYIKN